MGKKNHRIPADVKADILKRVKEDGIPVSQAANEAGVHETTVYDWLSKGVKSQPSWMDYNKIKKEKEELLRIIGDLTVQLSTTQKKSW